MKSVTISILEKIIEKNEYLCSKSFHDTIKEERLLFDSFIVTRFKTQYIFKVRDDRISYVLNFIETNKKTNSNLRSEQAIDNNTHSVNCQYSLIHILKDEKIESHIISANNSINNSTNKKAIIIENLDSFIEYKKMIDIIELNIDEMDVIYGDGGNILNKKNFPFLNHYDHIYTLFDLDQAGFEMYMNLKINLTALVTNIYIKNKEDFFKKIKFRKDFLTVKDFRIKFKELLSIDDIECLNIIEKYGTLEQEIFLLNTNKE